MKLETKFDYNATTENQYFITSESDKAKLKKIRDMYNKTSGGFRPVIVSFCWSLYSNDTQHGIVMGYERNISYLTIYAPVNVYNMFLKINIGNMSYVKKSN